MGTILDQANGWEQIPAPRCPICGRANDRANHCRHVRWTFDQGDPLDFARFALHNSPYVRGRGHQPSEIPQGWWQLNGDWIIEQIDYRLHIGDGYVFGELGDLDVFARDVWKRFRPDQEPAAIARTDIR
jgi:hypothetical protein